MQQQQEDERIKLASLKEEFQRDLLHTRSELKQHADKRVQQEETRF